MFVEVIQSRLPEGNDLGMFRQFDQFAGGNAILFVRLMRMRSDRTIDVREPSGDIEQCSEPADPRRNRYDASDAGGFGPGDDSIEIIGKIGKIEVAMAVDQHRLLTIQAAVGST